MAPTMKGRMRASLHFTAKAVSTLPRGRLLPPSMWLAEIMPTSTSTVRAACCRRVRHCNPREPSSGVVATALGPASRATSRRRFSGLLAEIGLDHATQFARQMVVHVPRVPSMNSAFQVPISNQTFFSKHTRVLRVRTSVAQGGIMDALAVIVAIGVCRSSIQAILTTDCAGVATQWHHATKCQSTATIGACAHARRRETPGT